MNKEDIESFGFKFKGRSLDIWFEKLGVFNIGSWTSYKINLHYGIIDHRLYILALDGSNEETLFQGKIETKEEFSILLKQIGLL